MSFPTGVLDGSFVKFEGFDVNLHDVGNFFPDLSGQAKIDALKTATLEPGALWFVFNSNGWAKTWTNISPSDFIQSNSTLYIQIEFPGWVFTQGADANGNDFENVGFNATPAIIAQIAQRSNPSEVVGFNTNGWIKSKIVNLTPTSAFPSLIQGTYVSAASA